ncbi:hypothetical protein [Paraburkholderia fungorum]|uniref:hypothetical protein n=1 Tax=Paraburkholderia fungorum TaxID=134537 RepID=UPI002091E776|nr:hypothetical protein [Paraburkholderia fungorum]USU21668.1 hypothetical protein NFE55_33820 [Paraburkholderia fungorum]USU29616.1 hypothetical protein NFS19_27750 [Paraburkholderia fungorum]
MDIAFVDHGLRPDGVHQFAFRYDPPGGGSEHGKNLEGARSQGYNFAVLEQRSNPQIDLKTAQLDHATTGVRRSNGIRHLLTRI